MQAKLHRNTDGLSKGKATVEYAHPLEAAQALKMFKNAKLLSREIVVKPDKIGPLPSVTGKLPDGLVDVGEGLGMNGSRLKVRYLNGDAVVHNPDCYNQGAHPVSGAWRTGLKDQGDLGGGSKT